MTLEQIKWYEERFASGPNQGLGHDFQAWLRLQDLDDSHPDLDRLFAKWDKSKKKGKNGAILDRRRRAMFSPGRFHAASPAGVYLNKNFVQGWRGINPARPGTQCS